MPLLCCVERRRGSPEGAEGVLTCGDQGGSSFGDSQPLTPRSTFVSWAGPRTEHCARAAGDLNHSGGQSSTPEMTLRYKLLLM